MWIIKTIKIKCFYPPRILNEHWCIYSCLQIPPRENWFQCVRRVYTTAINFPCFSTLVIVIYLTCSLKNFSKGTEYIILQLWSTVTFTACSLKNFSKETEYIILQLWSTVTFTVCLLKTSVHAIFCDLLEISKGTEWMIYSFYIL